RGPQKKTLRLFLTYRTVSLTSLVYGWECNMPYAFGDQGIPSLLITGPHDPVMRHGDFTPLVQNLYLSMPP
ncbi:hypothetical protein BDR03DRAFT_961792, partial [Suillus americanus]